MVSHDRPPEATLADDGVPFVLVGIVESWDPPTRVLRVGGQQFSVPSLLPADFLKPKVHVTITGHRPREGSGPWTVTEIWPHQAGF